VAVCPSQAMRGTPQPSPAHSPGDPMAPRQGHLLLSSPSRCRSKGVPREKRLGERNRLRNVSLQGRNNRLACQQYSEAGRLAVAQTKKHDREWPPDRGGYFLLV